MNAPSRAECANIGQHKTSYSSFRLNFDVALFVLSDDVVVAVAAPSEDEGSKTLGGRILTSTAMCAICKMAELVGVAGKVRKANSTATRRMMRCSSESTALSFRSCCAEDSDTMVVLHQRRKGRA